MRIVLDDTVLFFDVEGMKLAPTGTDMREKPTLILLHGGPGFDHSGFKPQFSTLSNFAQIIYLDHRGQGRSDVSPPDRMTLAQWGDDVKTFCDLLDIQKPFVYGVSFGGMVAQSYAIRHPNHASGIILDSTGPRMRLDLTYEAFERLGGPEARDAAEAFWTNPESTDAWNDYLKSCYTLYNSTPQDPDAKHRSIIRRSVIDHFFTTDGEGWRYDFRNQLSRITAPVLVLSGTEDPITPPGLSDEIMASLSKGIGTLASIDGAGHGVYRDKPAEAFALVRDFITTAMQTEKGVSQ